MLLLATVRPQSELEDGVAAELALLGTRMEIERLPLGGLSMASCEQLACSLLTGNVMADWLERITTESKGHPLFVSVLSRYAVSHQPSLGAELSLEAALGQKLEGLDGSARALLELLSLAGVPCSLGLLSRTLGWEPERVRRCASELVSANLLRRLSHQQLACFHDSVRATVLATLGKERALTLHRTLATALVREPGYDPALLAVHLEATDQVQAALAAHHQAGDLALAALAFGKAEHHYACALRLAARIEAEPHLLTTLGAHRGHALARAGRSALAAQQYLEASAHADTAHSIELRVWAAQHLLQSGQVDAGLRAAHDVLSELGVPLPMSESGALARLVWDRLCLGIRGLELASGKPEASPAERAKRDAMWSLGQPVSWGVMLPGATLVTRHLRRSLGAAEPLHAARALASEAALLAMQDPDAPERSDALFARARTLYEADQQPALEAWMLFSEGAAAIYRIEYTTACEKLERAEALLCARCPAEPWLLTNVRSSLANSWWAVGQFGGQVTRFERWLAEAAERDDLFAIASLETLGSCSLRFLLRDEPDRMREKVAEVLAAWPREPFGLVHLGELVVSHTEAMYRRGDSAWQALEAERVRHERAFLLKTNFGKAVIAMYRAQAGLSAYSLAANGPLAVKYLDGAKAAGRVLRRSKGPLGRFASVSFEAQLAIVEGEAERALALARATASEAGRYGLGLIESSLVYFEGSIEGGDAGRAKCERALTNTVSQGWRDPRRALTMMCPGIDCIEAKSKM